MKREKDFYNSPLSKISAGATYDDLSDSRVASGAFLVVTHISLENETTAFTKARVGIYYRGSIYWHEEEISPVAGELYWTRSRLFVPGDSNLILRLTGCTSGDSLKANIQGHLYTPIKNKGV